MDFQWVGGKRMVWAMAKWLAQQIIWTMDHSMERGIPLEKGWSRVADWDD